MILTNLDSVPGRMISETLGMVYGYARVKERDDGKWVLERDRPWSDTPGNFEDLFHEAEARLALSGGRKGADAIVNVEGRLSRDGRGLPEVILMGTAVRLSGDGEEHPEQDERDHGNSISFQVDGEEMSWKPPQAATPTMDVLKKMKERGTKEVRGYVDQRSRVLALAQEVGMPVERAGLLIKNGFDTIESISQASVKDLSSIEGINPTQARMMRKKAREMAAEE